MTSDENIQAREYATSKSNATEQLKSKSREKRARKLASKLGRKSKSKAQKRDKGARVAVNTKTGAALKFSKLGAFGGRGARTSAIENAIAGAGARGITIRDIEAKTNAAAVAMHVRTLYTGARPTLGRVIGRKRDEATGAFLYFKLSAKKGASKKSPKTSATTETV